MRNLWICFLLFLSINSYGQVKADSIRFQFTFNGEEVRLNKAYYSESLKDSIRFDNLKMYVSNGELWSKRRMIDTLDTRYHLIDLEIPSSQYWKYTTDKDFVLFKFTFGIDSVTNISGAMGGDLDPVMGMYWAWNSGYINFKMEGSTPACATRKNRFQIHLGGYQAPFPTYFDAEYLVDSHNPVVMEIPVDKFLATFDLTKQPDLMSPGKEAYHLSRLLGGVIHPLVK